MATLPSTRALPNPDDQGEDETLLLRNRKNVGRRMPHSLEMSSEEVEGFHKSRFVPSRFLLGYRTLFAVIYVWAIINIVVDPGKLVYLTHWTAALTGIHFVLGAILISKNPVGKMSSLHKLALVVQNVTTGATLGVHVLYMILLYHLMGLDVASAFVHVVNAYAVLLDKVLSCAPTKYEHVHHVGIYVMVYVSWAFIFNYASGEGIYYFMNFKNTTYSWFALAYVPITFTGAFLLVCFVDRLAASAAKSCNGDQRSGTDDAKQNDDVNCSSVHGDNA